MVIGKIVDLKKFNAFIVEDAYTKGNIESPELCLSYEGKSVQFRTSSRLFPP